MWFAGLVALIAIVAVVVATAAPRSWQSLIVADQQTDGSVATVFQVWLHNFALCSVLGILGAAAHASRRGGHVAGTRALLIVATLLQTRHALAIGLVGGLDPDWLLQAAPWWLLEFAAIAIVGAAMWRAWETSETSAAAALLARALFIAGGVLITASVLEVAST